MSNSPASMSRGHVLMDIEQAQTPSDDDKEEERETWSLGFVSRADMYVKLSH